MVDVAVARVSRLLPASPERVFRLFSTADLVARWLSPAPDVKLRVLEYDFREDGNYRFEYHTPNMPIFRVNGVFGSIQPPHELVFSWIIEPPDEHAGIDSVVRISVTARGAASLMTIIHERLDLPGSADRHQAGWAGALDRMEHALSDRQ